MKSVLPSLRFAAITILATLVSLRAESVLINEIMYHPVLHRPEEEFIELHNTGATNVSLAGWQLRQGVEFQFPGNASVPAGGFLVVAADTNRFHAIYPDVQNVIGNWTGTLNNSRQTIVLTDATGFEADRVTYADEGDWAVRQRGDLDHGHRGWDWLKEPDGLGKTLELRNPSMPNEYGQNWGASLPLSGTPGKINSVATNDVAPLIINVGHFPIIPRSTENVSVVARVLDESTNGVQAWLHYRIDSITTNAFTSIPMFDDGQHQDGAANDRVFGASLPPATNNAVIEFYLTAVDGGGHVRTFPAPALMEDRLTYAQNANLLYQVDDLPANHRQPIYKLIMREIERVEILGIGSSADAESNAEMNGTFISVDGAGTEIRYLVGIRNRGHGSRVRKPNNYRVNFRTDDTWKGVEAINLNGQISYLQHVGAAIALQAGVAGAHSTAVQVRVNNADLSLSGGPTRTYGSYAANEVLNSDWAEEHSPMDSGGNIYRAIRDLAPGDLSYRGTNSQSYTNSYFKTTNVAEDNWTDLIRLTDVLTNTPDADYAQAVREVADVDQWLRHLAVMALLDSRETGLNTGHGDDYFMYRGEVDQRFILLFYDLDSIFGFDSSVTNATIFGAATLPAFNRLLNFPEFRARYFQILDELIRTTFSEEQINAVIDQALFSYVPESVMSRFKTWMNGRREYVRGFIAQSLPSRLPIAQISGVPRARTPIRTATLRVFGEDITHYRFSLNGGEYSSERSIFEPIQLENLQDGSYAIRVLGRDTSGTQQLNPTESATWTVEGSWPGIRFNEVLASNRAAVPRNDTFPDLIELFNESGTSINLSGFRLIKGTSSPSIYFFPAGTSVPAGGYLVLAATSATATESNTGFGLSASGEALFLVAPGTNSIPFTVDQVSFGNQLTDFSIGRVAGGEWALTRPTIGTANIGESTGSRFSVAINEWLAGPESGAAVGEFIELFNRDALPVDIGGLFLTDQPIGHPSKQPIPSLSFIAGGGYFLFSGNGNATLSFRLNTTAGEIALMQAPNQRVDSVVYTAERSGVSSGRTPDGQSKFAPFELPTPGGANGRPDLPATARLITFLPPDHLWKYDESGNNLRTEWRETNYSDAAWNSGRALLASEESILAEPIRTPLSANSQKVTFYFRTKFVIDPNVVVSGLQASHFIDDGAVFYLNGVEINRFNMPPGDLNYESLAATDVNNARLQGPYVWPVEFLRPGENTVAVEVHQYRGASSDVVFGLVLEGFVLTNSVITTDIVLNEILTQNSNLAEPDGSTPDWIELHNSSSNDLDLGGLSLSDDPALPRRWVFPPGSLIRAGGYFSVACDGSQPANAANSGFALKGSGAGVYLFAKEAADGTFPLLDSIRYGLLPQDYSLGRNYSASNWTLNLPSIGRPNTSVNFASREPLRINEWLANPRNADDWFEIHNPSTQPVDLSGLLLSDDPSERGKSPVPNHSYIGVGKESYLKFVADGNTENGPDHVAFRLSAAAENIILSHPNGATIDAVSFVNQAEGVSEGRLPDGGTQVIRFPSTISPGHPNHVLLGNVLINEILTHTDPPLEDAVELFNAGAELINLSGWFLSDDQDDLKKYAVPAGTSLPSGGYKVFYEGQFNALPGDLTSFSFSSAHGDLVVLSEALADGTLTGRRAMARFGPAENAISFGRIATSSGIDYSAMQARTFGKDQPLTVQDFRLGTGALNSGPQIGPVIISEIMSFPPMNGTNDNVRYEFIELHNVSSTPIPLYDPAHPTNRWKVGGGIDFELPSITLAAGTTVVLVSFDPVNDQNAFNDFRAHYATSAKLIGPYAGKLGNVDDTVELFKPDPPQTIGPDAGHVPYILVEQVAYSSVAPWPSDAAGSGKSFHRRPGAPGWTYGNEALNWFAAAPTPGRIESSTSDDSDGDGMSNFWEEAYGLDPNDPGDEALDKDGDGFSNRSEFLMGTNPTDPSSSFTVRLRSQGAELSLLFVALQNRTFSVQALDNLNAQAWNTLVNIAAGPTREISIPLANPAGSRFYRIVSPAEPQ